jgi:uncharacterized phage-like protein YoqJ
LKNLIIGVTGHRPHLLGGYGDDIFKKLVNLASDFLIDNQPKLVITGMALGWDQAVALACIRNNIAFLAAVPFKGQENPWPERARNRYKYLLSEANQIDYISEKYTGFAMEKRNMYIVDNCELLLCLYNGGPGGTKHCITYAKSKNKETINLWDKYDF